MDEVSIGRTANRQVLGSMNEFVGMMGSHPWPPTSLTALSLWLAESPCSPIAMRSPGAMTRVLLEDTSELA